MDVRELNGASSQFELPLKPVSRIFRVLAIGFGALFVMVAAAMMLALGWKALFGLVALWAGLMMICLGIHSPTRPLTRSPNSCLISSLSLCLTCVGYDWEIARLESELRLNKSIRGTLFQDLVFFLASNGIQYNAFNCSTVDQLSCTLAANRGPAIAILHQPILARPGGWGIILAPLRTIKHWTGLLNPDLPKHAVVVHGVEGNVIDVYDPAFGTSHRVPWNRFALWLAPEAFNGSPFLAIPKPICFTSYGSDTLH